jgi:prophage maintenance system killer protein
MARYRFPTADEIIELNKRVLMEIPAKKADSHKVLSRAKLQAILDDAEKADDDVYNPATELLFGIIKGHPFASGVRRTAVTLTSVFLKMNGAETEVPHDPEVIKGIREGFYNKSEVKEWLKGHGIRKRPVG